MTDFCGSGKGEDERLRLGTRRGTPLLHVMLGLRILLTEPRNVPPSLFALCGSSSFERLLEIGEQVAGIFDAKRNAHESVAYARFIQIFRTPS